MHTLRIITLLLIGAMAGGCTAPTVDSAKPHHSGDGFRNTYQDAPEQGFLDFFKWRWGHFWGDIPDAGDYGFPLASPDTEFLRHNRNHTTLTWIGHATLLLQLHGRNILTDPQFSPRASPVQWAGPQRAVPPVPALADLPPIDAVIISHDHYDSLDLDSIRALHARPGGEQTLFLVPLALGDWFRDQGITRVVELDWWDAHEAHGLRYVAVPTRHWSKRTLFGRNKTLWAGWAVLAPDFRFLFVGDSGYTPQFREIGARLGPFDLTAIPIGAYEPRWFMRRHHINPQEAVQTHLDVQARRSVAIHWGTFILTDEPLDEPPVKLREALEAAGMSAQEFMILQHGQTIGLNE